MRVLKLILFFLIPITSLLTACGSSKDTVTITVNTAIPVKTPASVNLSKTLMSLMSVTPGQDCLLLVMMPALLSVVVQSLVTL